MSLKNQAWKKYVNEVRRDSSQLYYCTRLLEKSYLLSDVPDGIELIYKATLTVFKFDPLAFLTSHVSALDMFSDDELEQLTTVLFIDGDDDATNFLRGQLWSEVARCSSTPEKFARRGHAFLTKVTEALANSEHDYLSALAECCRVIDYDAYKQLVPSLLASREAEWRGYDLMNAFEASVERGDWDTYETWRPQWDQLPKNAHICECNFNKLHTFDGLLSLEREDIASIPGHLQKAADLRGCPHLNSGAARMNLVEHLIDRHLFLKESLAYVDACKQFCPDDERIDALIEKINLAQSAASS